MYSSSIEKLIKIFSKFPTVGPRTAARFVFYLMRLSDDEVKEILEAVSDFKKSIKICSFCFNPFESSINNNEILCPICSNSSRNRKLLCLIEKETDLSTLEKTKKYNGLYFIFNGNRSILKNDNLRKIKGEQLVERIKSPEKFGLSGADFEEIIIAFNPTVEGEASALYLERLLKPLAIENPDRSIKVTRLGRGLPMGGELEYADEETLGSALDGRK